MQKKKKKAQAAKYYTKPLSAGSVSVHRNEYNTTKKGVPT
jgi:hypothetical protein